MSDISVFLCLDVEHDMDLAERLEEQSLRGGSGFVISARSEPGSMSDRWCESVRRRMSEVDEVIVICGEHTEGSMRVDFELRTAQEQNKPFFLLWGRRDRMCTMPTRVTRAACMYSWTWEILLQQISETLRNAQPLELPDHYKRP